MNGDNMTYFDSFGVEYIPKFIGNKNIEINIYSKQAYCSIMYGCFCIGFINFMLNNKRLTYFTNLFSPKKN